MNYQELKAELEAPAYTELDDSAAAAALNDPVIAVRRRVAIERLQATAYENGLYVNLNVVLTNAEAPTELKALCLSVKELVDARFVDVDLDSPAAQQMFSTLVGVGIATVQQAAQVDALADAVVTRAAKIGLGYVTPGDVAIARGGGW